MSQFAFFSIVIDPIRWKPLVRNRSFSIRLSGIDAFLGGSLPGRGIDSILRFWDIGGKFCRIKFLLVGSSRLTLFGVKELELKFRWPSLLLTV